MHTSSKPTVSSRFALLQQLLPCGRCSSSSECPCGHSRGGGDHQKRRTIDGLRRPPSRTREWKTTRPSEQQLVLFSASEPSDAWATVWVELCARTRCRRTTLRLCLQIGGA